MEAFETYSQGADASDESEPPDSHADSAAFVPSEPNPFMEPWLLEPARHAFGDGPAIIDFESRIAGRLAGRVPLYRKRSYYDRPVPHLAFWMHNQAFLGTPLVESGSERRFWRDLLSWCDTSAGAALFLHCPLQFLDGPVAQALISVAKEQHRPAAKVMVHERAALQSTLSPEDYFTRSTSAGRRKELRRQRRRLEELGRIAFVRSSDTNGLDRWVADYHALEQSGWKGKAQSALASSEAGRTFFRDALCGAAEADQLERVSLTLDGTPVAMLATFVCPPGAYLFKTAYDEQFSRFSPGVLLQQENLALLDRSDIRYTDSCAAAGHPMIERLWSERRTIGGINIAIGGSLRRAAAHRFFRIEHGSEVE